MNITRRREDQKGTCRFMVGETGSVAYRIPRLNPQKRRKIDEEEIKSLLAAKTTQTMRFRKNSGAYGGSYRGGIGRGPRGGRGGHFATQGPPRPRFSFDPRPLNNCLKFALKEDSKSAYLNEYFQARSKEEQYAIEKKYAQAEHQINGIEFPGNNMNYASIHVIYLKKKTYKFADHLIPREPSEYDNLVGRFANLSFEETKKVMMCLPRQFVVRVIQENHAQLGLVVNNPAHNAMQP
jgi:hypothetical protein